MYPAELPVPRRPLASLKDVQEIHNDGEHTVSGHCVKAMACDPFGHPVLAATPDNKVTI